MTLPRLMFNMQHLLFVYRFIKYCCNLTFHLYEQKILHYAFIDDKLPHTRIIK